MQTLQGVGVMPYPFETGSNDWSRASSNAETVTGLWKACNLTSFLTMSHWPVDYPLLPVIRDPGSKPQGGYFVKPGFSC
jgi:hypothetical protein